MFDKSMFLEHSVPHKFVKQREGTILTKSARRHTDCRGHECRDCSIALDSYRKLETHLVEDNVNGVIGHCRPGISRSKNAHYQQTLQTCSATRQ